MKRILSTAALVAAIISPAFAGPDPAPMSQHDGKDMKDMKQMAPAESDAGFYVAAYGGAQFHTDYGDNRQTVTSGGSTLESHEKISSFWGGVGGLKAGYNFESMPMGNFMGLRLQPAVEAEALYIGMDDSHATGSFAPGVNTRFSTNSGDFFLNGILRFKNNSKLTPYVGVGAGLQYITTHGSLTGGDVNGNLRGNQGANVTGLDTEDLDFAAQAIFGLDYSICPHLSLFSEYKFIDALGTDGHAGIGGAATYRFKPDQIEQNLITAGVKYSF